MPASARTVLVVFALALLPLAGCLGAPPGAGNGTTPTGGSPSDPPGSPPVSPLPPASPPSPPTSPPPAAPPGPSPPPPSSPPPAPTTAEVPGPEFRPRLEAREVVAGLAQPIGLEHAGDGSGRLFVLEQPGRVRLLRGGALVERPFLDLTSQILAGGERGLLGLAFAPDYESSGRFYVHYTDKEGATVIARYRVGAEADRADPASGEVLLRVEQPYANHNGGQIAFGPDGFLYVALGDGGYGGDPHGHGQDPRTLLGSLLRLDVGRTTGYAVPDDNPFAPGGARPREGAPEVWAYGLRNPWRFSFDRATGDLYVADVGQREWEEVNVVPAGAPGGLNFGWNVWEGNHRYRPNLTKNETNGAPTFPAFEYGHGDGHCSVTGGYVYRGKALPDLRGAYVFGDYCSGALWAAWPQGGAWVVREAGDVGFRLSSFGEDEAGELYALDHGGRVMRLVAASS